MADPDVHCGLIRSVRRLAIYINSYYMLCIDPVRSVYMLHALICFIPDHCEQDVRRCRRSGLDRP